MDKKSSCVLLADRHHGLRDGVRGLLETEFDTVFMVADEATDLMPAVEALLAGKRYLSPGIAR